MAAALLCSLRPHLRRDWAHPGHICAGTITLHTRYKVYVALPTGAKQDGNEAAAAQQLRDRNQRAENGRRLPHWLQQATESMQDAAGNRQQERCKMQDAADKMQQRNMHRQEATRQCNMRYSTSMLSDMVRAAYDTDSPPPPAKRMPFSAHELVARVCTWDCSSADVQRGVCK